VGSQGINTQPHPAESHPRIGIDHVAYRHVDEALSRFGDRYLERIFTADERRYADAGGALRIPRLAARFAAKEAVRKVLRPVDGLQFTSVAVRNHPDGAPDVELTGTALELADRIGAHHWSISLTHADGHAAAAVIVLCKEPHS
jgi:holo-[acyl-carrier protein] synthase